MDYPQWKASSEDGQVLIWPEPRRIVEDTRRNSQLLKGAGARIQGVAMTELRRRQRQWLGHAQDDRPIIATGHQTELYHPGVWAKNVLIDTVANRLQGEAIHVAVDTDEPKHLNLRWPGGNQPVTDDPNLPAAAWSGLLDGPTPIHLEHVHEHLKRSAGAWPFDETMMIWPFLSAMRRLTLESTKLSAGLTNAMHQLDWDLGMKHHALVASPVWQSPPFLVFVYHVMARARAMAADYNGALGAYRATYRIDNPGRPMPDLKHREDQCESPFWVDDLEQGGRRRAMLHRQGDRWVLRHGGEEFVFDDRKEGWGAATELAGWLRVHGLRISPRALMLTTFFRLMVVDQFVHGIGGGRYDQVADDLMKRHFDVEPPRFAVTTATLYFPLAVGRSRACLPCIQQEGHRLRHGILGEEKMEMIQQIESLPRKSMERAMLFSGMHRRLNESVRDRAIVQWEERYRAARAADAEDQGIFDRELFYALQPRERLEAMIGKYRREFAV